MANTKHTIAPVDEMLPPGKLFVFGLQHVLAMYAGAVAVPLIIAAAAGLSKSQTAFLINADLFTCGLATLLQTLGIWKIGIKIPVHPRGHLRVCNAHDNYGQDGWYAANLWIRDYSWSIYISISPIL